MYKRKWPNVIAIIMLISVTIVTILSSLEIISKLSLIYTGIVTLLVSGLFGIKNTIKPSNNHFLILFYSKPKILGVWEATGMSNYFENDDVKVLKNLKVIMMEQKYKIMIRNNSIVMELIKEGLNNKTLTSFVSMTGNGSYAVSFKTESFSADLQLKDNNPPHKGSGTLHFDEATGDLIYEYWTNRFSNGSLRLKKVGDEW